MKKQLATMLTCLIMLTAILPAWAQESTDSPSFDLEQVIVTAAKREQTLKDTPADISVITAQDLKKMGAKTFDEAIRLIPGVMVNRPHGIASVTPQKVTIRGVQSTAGTLLMVDGVPINNASNEFVNLNVVPVDSIERVEVIKGGYSALYGTNALGGIINIITKNGNGLKKGEKIFSTKLEFGNYNTKNYKLSLEGAEDKFGYSLNFQNLNTDNYYYRDKVLKASGLTLSEINADNYDYNGKQINGKIKYQIDEKSNLTFLVGNSKTISGTGISTLGSGAAARTKDAEQTTNQHYFGINYQTMLNDKIRTSVNLTQHEHDYHYLGTYKGKFSDQKVYAKSNKAEVQFESQLNQQHYLTFGFDKTWKGADWGYNEQDTGNVLDPKYHAGANNFAAYLQDEIKVNEKTTLVLGGRYDQHSQFGSEFSPKAGVLYKIDEKTRLKANAGHSFRAPALNELYQPAWEFRGAIPPATPAQYFFSNPNLRPEKVDSYDLGIEKQFNDKLSGSLTFFLNNQKDLITTVQTTIGGLQGREYQNIDKSQAKGLEFGLKNKLSQNLDLNFNYTYLDLKDKNKDQRIDGAPLNTGSLGLYYNQPTSQGIFLASLIARGIDSTTEVPSGSTSKQKIPGYVVYDLNLNWQMNNQGEIFLTVNNLTNKEYKLNYSTYGFGQSIIAGANFKF